jgi:hypothetical protein
VKRCADLNQARQAQGICSIGNFVYVAGGITEIDEALRTCERYNTLTDVWEVLPCDLPFNVFSVSLVTASKRYIYGLGVANYQKKVEPGFE